MAKAYLGDNEVEKYFIGDSEVEMAYLGDNIVCDLIIPLRHAKESSQEDIDEKDR